MWCKRRRNFGVPLTGVGISDSSGHLRVGAFSETHLKNAAYAVRASLRKLVSNRPSVEQFLLEADLDVEVDRIQVIHALRNQQAWLSKWYDWCVRRIANGGAEPLSTSLIQSFCAGAGGGCRSGEA